MERAPAHTSTFQDNLSLPVHRWFRYSAGFSALWVRDELEHARAEGRANVLDPFAGSGTVLLEAQRAGLAALGLEPHPFVARVAQAKLRWQSSPELFRNHARAMQRQATELTAPVEACPPLIERCYPPAVRQKLCALKQAWRRQAGDPALTELLWLALVAILRPCSPAGTAQWQYVLPNKSKTALPPETAFERQTRQMWADMLEFQREARDGKASLLQDDARTCAAVPSGWADLVITSPPYANNYDYADAARLEMTFMDEIGGWGDLQAVVRRHLVRACTQHVAALKQPLEAYLAEPLLAPIHSELELICRRLAGIRESRGGKKPYHLMLAGYFQDLAQVWHSLRRVVAPGGRVCFVIGDSAPYGVHAPVDRWFGELALAAGFRSFRFEKLRDRNTKWKNRKHTVPLHEGRLWVEG